MPSVDKPWEGVDVSHWDGSMDLAAWKKRLGLSFVIIKIGGHETGLGRYKDSKFEDYYKQAKAAGLHVGAYYYSVSTDTANARADADHCAQLLAGHDFDMPVYLDVEDQRQFAKTKRQLTDVIKTFCDRINVLGYYAGIYTGGHAYLNNMYGPEELGAYADWIAWWRERWPDECGSIGMHQVGGINLNGHVVYDDVSGYHDYDRCAIDYPSKIKPSPQPEPVPQPEPKTGTVERLMELAYADLGYYAPNDPEPGSKAGRWLANLTGESWLAGPSREIWWCCAWVSMIAYLAEVNVPGFPTQNTDIALRNGAKSKAVPKNTIRRGDIVIFDWNWDGATDHIGFATSSLNSKMQFTTIEGNVGNAVAEKTRDMSNVAYVIRPDYADAGKSEPAPAAKKNNRDGGKLDVDGIGGYNTILDMQHILDTYEDGTISGQYRDNADYVWGIAAIEYGGGGSQLVEAIQRLVGATVDRQWGRETSKKLQKYLIKLGYSCGASGADEYFGRQSVMALQECINDGKFGK